MDSLTALLPQLPGSDGQQTLPTGNMQGHSQEPALFCIGRKSESRGPRCSVAAHAQGPWIATHAWRAGGPRRATGSDGSREACSGGFKSDAISAVCTCHERLLGVNKIGIDRQTQGVTGWGGELAGRTPAPCTRA